MNTSKTLFLFTILFTTSTLVIAQAPPDNSTYKLNKNGLIISTLDSRVIYLGKDCDAYSKKYGKGVWSTTNAGIMVKFKNYSDGIPFGEEVFQLREGKENCPEI